MANLHGDRETVFRRGRRRFLGHLRNPEPALFGPGTEAPSLRWYNSYIRKEGTLCLSLLWRPVGTRPKITDGVMYTFLKIFVVLVLALALVGWLADRRAGARRPDVTPGLSFLPGDFKYESPNGNVRIYFPIVTSIVLSVLLTLILRFIG